MKNSMQADQLDTYKKLDTYKIVETIPKKLWNCLFTTQQHEKNNLENF